ncbi:putative membrane protein [Wickerhamomyces ciferrii]|uniref:Membrane protein n=1 Tax=Wickerhamomyces ciferrii (strain ATCC 14091 / BCRC 22168 / CBS 111 / JCM 3599 / NBRC 0793 / NRRL Y-1031 F-60-10) TaxID=1206466 RepID=K0KM03_WICCF|nr:uncharacterized protein BN7_1703 [Wickerhamomyces ciferrii]CCH42158.1 putative membrane protein [Wickerhamomyces ciferrii]
MSNGARVQIREQSHEQKDKLHRDAAEKAKLNINPKLVKLISVKLKEAALDSPSFRASVNYFNSQVDQTEHWIEGLLKSLKKYPQQFNDFKEVNNVLFNQLIPDFLKDGLINQDNSVAILDTSKTNLGSLWESNTKALELKEAEITELLSEFSKNEIRHFKDFKKNFEFFQNKFDTLISKYSSQNKSKDPSALREDAFQLYEVRKSYLAASLDICVEISKLHQQLDFTFVNLAELLFKGKVSFDEKYFEKARAWSVAVSKSVKTLIDDMIYSRNQIEEATISQFTPSRDLASHNPALINPQTLINEETEPNNNNNQQSFEKHGWLFMKTTVGKPARTIWVRRWVFVKSGIFGLFSLAPSKNFVQETDKIGVLLSNIRYAPDEDRRFCFEIKTIDVTIMFQAESLEELKSWLTVFSMEKKRAIENSDSDSGKYAFGRYPPLLYEFASTSLTSIDMELTTSKAENTKDDDTQTTVVSSFLSQLVGGKEHLDFRLSGTVGDFQEPDISAPMITKMTKLSILAHAFLNSTIIPTAVTANIWGSVNWGTYYVSDHDISYKLNQPVSDSNISSLSKTHKYPDFYPQDLKTYDIQLKSLFDTSVPKDELVVLHFSCLWALNPKQELSGRCFVTTENCYFYLNSTGFVALLKKSIADLVAVDVTNEKDWEVLKVYGIEGLNMKGRIFLDDGKLIQKKLDFLINNLSKDEPKLQNEVIQILKQIETDEIKKIEKKNSIKRKNTDASVQSTSGSTQINSELYSFQPFSGVVSHNKNMKTNYNDEYHQCTVRTFDAPAKAIFHILFGDHSSILRDSIRFIDNDEYEVSPWYSKGSELIREIELKLKLSKKLFSLKNNNAGESVVQQTIEDFVDMKYYRIREDRTPLKIAMGQVLQLTKKYVIIETDTKTSKLYIYTKLDSIDPGVRSLFAPALRKTSKSFFKDEDLTMIEQIEHNVSRLGSHGKIIKAIRTFGNLSKSDEVYIPKERQVFNFTLNLMFRLYFKKFWYDLASAILCGSKLIFSYLGKILGELAMNKLILLLLGISLLFNSFLVGKSTVSFWTAKKAEHLVKDFTKELNMNKMERAIYINEIDALSSSNFNESSICFTKFMNSGNIEDYASQSVDKRFRNSRHEIAVKRNELLVELKILEKVEKELINGSWKNFLLSELNLCKKALEDLNVTNPDLEIYCSSCIEDFQKVSA